MRVTDRRLAEAVAVHEASHYVVGSVLGCRPSRVVARADGGHVRLERTPDPWTPKGCRDAVAVHLAGGLGETMRFGVPVLSARSDHEKTTRALARFEHAGQLRMQREGIELAARVLRARWDLVEAIALEVLEHGAWPR